MSDEAAEIRTVIEAASEEYVLRVSRPEAGRLLVEMERVDDSAYGGLVELDAIEFYRQLGQLVRSGNQEA